MTNGQFFPKRARDARSTQGKRNAQGVVRVLAGSLKGQNLITPGNGQTHPMGAREKLALFNMLQPYLAAAKVLDAYAGSGALGIEALSRGAQEAVFVESSTRAAAIIKQNLQATKVALTTDSDRAAQVYCETTQKFCRRPAFYHYFSLILADPPYDNYHPEEIQSLAELLADEGILAVSFPKGTPTEFSGLELISYHSYAAAGIALYRRVAYA